MAQRNRQSEQPQNLQTGEENASLEGKQEGAENAEQTGGSVIPMAPGHVTPGGRASAYHQDERALMEQLGVMPVRAISLPTLPQMRPGDTVALLFLSEMRESNFKEEKASKPATIATVANMLTGEEHTYVVPTVVEKNLRESYPDHAYKGKSFLIRRGEQKANKRYSLYTIREIAGKPQPDASKAA